MKWQAELWNDQELRKTQRSDATPLYGLSTIHVSEPKILRNKCNREGIRQAAPTPPLSSGTVALRYSLQRVWLHGYLPCYCTNVTRTTCNRIHYDFCLFNVGLSSLNHCIHFTFKAKWPDWWLLADQQGNPFRWSLVSELTEAFRTVSTNDLLVVLSKRVATLFHTTVPQMNALYTG
jgi:hypothetical protein